MTIRRSRGKRAPTLLPVLPVIRRYLRGIYITAAPVGIIIKDLYTSVVT